MTIALEQLLLVTGFLYLTFFLSSELGKQTLKLLHQPCYSLSMGILEGLVLAFLTAKK